MFKDFDTAKKQLAELADVINKFKSDAVQLRLVDLLFGQAEANEDDSAAPELHERPRRRSKSVKQSVAAGGGGPDRKKKAVTGNGAVATLLKVYQSGYFKQGRTIGDICGHCKNNMAKGIKPNEISGKLGRMVHDGELARTKNKDGQYVYTNKA